MNRKLIEWDNKFSLEEESKIAVQRNFYSGQEELVEEGRSMWIKWQLKRGFYTYF
ncbi:MAG: hypothetical protein JKY01_03590 [Pseudomonadales bacterium]|nr:hypothetical protein [Pseudomonadales bacterium]